MRVAEPINHRLEKEPAASCRSADLHHVRGQSGAICDIDGYNDGSYSYLYYAARYNHGWFLTNIASYAASMPSSIVTPFVYNSVLDDVQASEFFYEDENDFSTRAIGYLEYVKCDPHQHRRRPRSHRRRWPARPDARRARHVLLAAAAESRLRR